MRGLNADSTAALWKLRGCVMLGRRGRRASEAGGGGEEENWLVRLRILVEQRPASE